MSSNEDTNESDEHEQEENNIPSDEERFKHDDDEDESDENHNNHDTDDEQEQEEETKNSVDPTNPLDEDSIEAAQNLTQEDVFGEDLSESSGDENNQHRHTTKIHRENEMEEDGIEENVEEQEEEEEEQITVNTPFVKCDLGREIHLVKLPSFMKIEPKPYDPQYFNDEVRDEDDEESKARLKLKIENTIRWRQNTNENGEIIRESNTRLVRWSDGSLSLHVGNEIFDVSKANIQSDHNHLFIRHQKSMQAQAVFRTKLAFRQHSHDSLAHLKLKFASKANPAPKVRVLSNIKAQMINTTEMKKKEDQRIKAEERRRNQQIRHRERIAYRDGKISTNYLEDRDNNDEDEEDQRTNIDQVSLNAIKNKIKNRRLKNIYRKNERIERKEKDDEDEDDNDDDDNDNDDGDDDDDDDEEEEEEEEEEDEKKTEDQEQEDDDPTDKLIGQRSSSSKKHRKLISSDEESNEEHQSKRKSSQSNRNHQEIIDQDSNQ